MRLVRYALAAGALLFGVLTISYLQGRFDRADLKKGVAAVEAKFPEARNCRAVVASRWRGLVTVVCDNQTRSVVEGEARSGFAGRGGDASPSRWLVDVIKGEISDGSEKMQD